MAVSVDVGVEIKRGWELYKANMALLILVGLLAGLLSAFTCFVLAGPMLAGELLIIQRLLKKDAAVPAVPDLFKGFDYFLNTFLFFLVMAIILGVCRRLPGANLAVGVVGALGSLGIMFVVFGKLSFSDALKKISQEISTGPFWMLVLTLFIAGLIGGLGILLLGIGLLFTMPIAACISVCAYHSAYEGATPEIQ